MVYMLQLALISPNYCLFKLQLLLLLLMLL